MKIRSARKISVLILCLAFVLLIVDHVMLEKKITVLEAEMAAEMGKPFLQGELPQKLVSYEKSTALDEPLPEISGGGKRTWNMPEISEPLQNMEPAAVTRGLAKRVSLAGQNQAGSGCLEIDVSTTTWVQLNSRDCNGIRCPPCFLLNSSTLTNSIAGKNVTFTGCSSMYISANIQMGGKGAVNSYYDNALETLTFANLNTQEYVGVADDKGTRIRWIPPKHFALATCFSKGDDVLYWSESSVAHSASALWPSNVGAAWSLRAKGTFSTDAFGTTCSYDRIRGNIICFTFNPTYVSNDGGLTWIQGGTPPTARWGLSSVGLDDGTVVYLGGEQAGNVFPQDVYRTTDGGTTFTTVTPTGLPTLSWGRASVAAVVTQDGHILILGGYRSEAPPATPVVFNDVWRSTDAGSSFTQVTGSASWSARHSLGAARRSDGAILVLGGSDYAPTKYNDVWASHDGGANWNLLTSSAEWGARTLLNNVAVRPDGTVLVVGGGWSEHNDVWASANGGTNWVQLTAAASWSLRANYVVMPWLDGSILLIGGYVGAAYVSEVWVAA